MVSNHEVRFGLILIGLVLLLAGCTSPPSGSLAGAAQVPALCVDSDGGNSPFTAGFVTFKGEKFADICVKGQLLEYACKNGVQTSTLQQCAAGSICENGACVRREQCQVVNGIVRHTDTNGRATNYATGCNAQGTTVLSYSCLANGSVSTQSSVCNPGTTCIDGACQAGASGEELRCTEIEDGIVYYNSTSGEEQELLHYCRSLAGGRQFAYTYSCRNDLPSFVGRECMRPEVCQDGACGIPQESCRVEGDRILGFDNQGREFSRFASQCLGNGQIRTTSCLENGSVSVTAQDCPDGEACAGNAMCASLSCEETDNGVLFINNSVEENFENYCDQFNRTIVYVCTPFGSGEIWRNNLGQCAQGTVCQEGECVGQ